MCCNQTDVSNAEAASALPEALPTAASFKRQKSLFERDFQQAVNGIGPLAEVGETSVIVTKWLLLGQLATLHESVQHGQLCKVYCTSDVIVCNCGTC